MTIAADDPRLTFVDIETASVPPTGLIEHIKNHWWIVHPEKGVAFWERARPLCDWDEAVTRSKAVMYPWAEVKLIPSVFVRVVDLDRMPDLANIIAVQARLPH